MLLNDFEPTVICKASKMAQSLENNPNPSINLVIAGHVDHGKSTLIGRLLHDTDSLTEGKMAAVKAMSERRGMPLEYAFLLDALQAERDQGITIDTTQVLFNSKKRSYLIIDAPGALSGEHAEQLVSEAHAIVTPLQPSFFDIDSTRRFLKHLQDIKRIRKGKVQILLLANRVKANSASAKDIQDFFAKIEQQPVAWISERTAYGQLAMQGLSVFDKTQKNYLSIQSQWQPLLNAIVDDPSAWF